MTRRIAIAHVAAGLGLGGCALLTGLDEVGIGTVTQPVGDGLVQTVRVETERLEAAGAPGPVYAFQLRSVVVNTSSQPVDRILTNGCSLVIDTDGAIGIATPMSLCGLPPMTTIEPGDSAVVTLESTASGAPGTYTLRVLHVLDPEKWVRVKVRLD